MASKVSAKRRPSVNAPSEGVASAKKVSFALYSTSYTTCLLYCVYIRAFIGHTCFQRKTAMRERTPGFADAMFSETTYCIKNGKCSLHASRLYVFI